MCPTVGLEVSPIMVHLASILFGLVAASPTMLAIGLKVLSIMPEFLTIVAQVSPILMKLSGIGLASFILLKLLPVSTNRAFVLPEILSVGLDVFVVKAEVAAFITQLAMIFTQILLVLLYLAPRVSRFRGSFTEFGLGEDGLGGDRSASEQCHCHTHLHDFSAPPDRSLSLDRELLLDVLPIPVRIAIASRSAVVDNRLR
jgi:hypothetical protein